MEKSKRKPVLIGIAVVLVLTLLIGAVLPPVLYGGYKECWWKLHGGKIDYTYVFVHGLGGKGEISEDELAPYWGGTTGSLPAYLRSEGYTVAAPTIGPFSSTWDRACELYAQLTGTKVDYGEAHAKAHGHARFGRTYTEPLVPDWGEKQNGGQRVKINLIGHSFGGAAVRLLTSLLAYGNEAEMLASGSETSPLFTGGKSDWVFSVTTLCAPHNGSQLTNMVDDLGSVANIPNATQLLVSVMFKLLQATNSGFGMLDLMLDQFGIGDLPQEQVIMTLERFELSNKDNAFYDLSPDGAAALNKTILTVDDVYYFSYAYSTVKEGKLLSGLVPETTTLPILYPLALAMAKYTGTTPGGIQIDDTWLANDGLVSVVSAQYPSGEAHVDLVPDMQFKKGIWHVAPTGSGDHGTVIGLNARTDETHDFYDTLFTMIDALKR